ncbi:MAG: methyl-accepting chemotaxis protein [Pseudomonadota bacterium]
MRKNLPVTGVEQQFSARANILSTTNVKGQITYINKDFIDISGFSKSELIGQNHHVVRHPDMPPPVFKMFWADLKSQKSWMGIVKNRCKNGDHYWVDAYVTPIKKDGSVEEYQSVRRKARSDYIKRAQEVYASINEGKTPSTVKPSPSLNSKIISAVIIPIVIPFLAYLLTGSALPVLISVLVAMLLSIIAVIIFLKPINAAVRDVQKITDDKIARYVYTGRSDEAGSIMLALKKLESENAALIGRINDMSETLSDNASNLSSAVSQSEAGTLAQFEQTEQVATAVDEMSVSIGTVADSARETSAASTNGLNKVKTGKEVVDANAISITELKTLINDASKVINEVSKSSSDIEKILDVILSIADQTNLLALNAAIEAARAGEAGRGFAVVADEVRSLANRTQESTKEIRVVIEGLQSGVKKSVDVMVLGETMAQDSVSKSNETAEYLEEILDAINKISNMSDQIAQAVDEQSKVAQSIGESVTSIKTSSEQNLEAVRLSGDVTDKSVNITRRLDQLTSQFWDEQQAV